MVNTVVDLLGKDVAKVSALSDNRGTPVGIASSVSGVSKRGVFGVLFSLTGAGDSTDCNSEVTVFGGGCSRPASRFTGKALGPLSTGNAQGTGKAGMRCAHPLGESLWLRQEGQAKFSRLRYPRSRRPWEQFLKVQAGRMPNPYPPEVGLRFARLMDLIRHSTATAGPVK